MSIFRLGSVKLHSGMTSLWKIDCDGLSIDDWETLAVLAAAHIGNVSEIVGIPNGGAPFARVLQRYVGQKGPRLIVDDVLTTGGSMREAMTRPDDLGLVVFARGALPPRVSFLFASWEAVDAMSERG